MNAERLIAGALALLLASGAAAETVTDEEQLTRAQLETTGTSVTLTAADALPTTARALLIELRFAEDPLAPAGGNAWTYTVSYRVTDGATTGAQRSLTLFRGADRDVFRAVDRVAPIASANVRVQIDGTSSTDAAAVPAGVVMTARVESVRYTAFARTSAPALSRTTGADPILQWTAVAGAEEYEVESVFVDVLEPAVSGSPFVDRLPVRFQTKSRTTPIDGYRTPGTVHFRVRAVGRHASDPRVRRFGAWSGTLAVPISAGGFEAGKNWRYARRYDGEGPAQGTLQYFDGNLRMRQAQSGAPDEARRLIAETEYDHEGRPAVNFLAVPQSGARMSYAAGFNRASDGTPYGPQHFDRDGVAPASNASGAGRYFSAANTARDAFTPYLADAGGHPFSVAEHKRDDSARLRAMSGFGAKNRLGGGHETVYVYGDAAEAQLKPLFGPNLGDARHFERTVTGDANRSFEVSYRNGSDHVVAQAVLGDPPANLADLPNAPSPGLVAVSMDANNRVDAEQGRSTLHYRIANAVNTAYFFAYSPTGVDYAADPGDSRFPPLCESCRYRLRIRIVDPEGNAVSLLPASTPQSDADCTGVAGESSTNGIDRIIENPNPPACPAAGTDYTRGYTVPPIRFCARLTGPGEYEVQKTLEFVDGDIGSSITDYRSKPGFFDISTYVDPVDPASCGDTCTQHCAAATGIDPAASPNDPQLRQCIASCEDPKGWVLDKVDQDKCDSLENQLGLDMTPNGRHHVAGAANATSDHPEYCHVGVCRAMRTSDRYDLDMGVVDTYDEALCKGYLNPTGLAAASGTGPPTPPASCTATPARDPFFATGGPGFSQRTTINAQLNNFTATIPEWADPATLSIWQFVADPRVNSLGSGAGPTPDQQWRLFRSLYLGAKKRIVIAHTESSAGFSCPFSAATNARVPKPPLPTTTVEVIDQIAGTTRQQCGTICAARVDGWVRQLAESCPTALDPARVRQSLDLYCASSCGANNPLASLIEDDIAAGDPNLAAALAALGPGCSLDDIAVEDPYVYQTVCGETCCTDTGPSDCAVKLVATLAERSPAATAASDVLDTATGQSLRTCMDWVDHVRFRPRTKFLSKHENQACTVVLLAPDGTELNLGDVRIVGPPSAEPRPPAGAQGISGVPYTGLTVQVEWRGAIVAAAIYSDCAIQWVTELKTPHCETNVVTTPPKGNCDVKPDPRRPKRLSYLPRSEACPIGETQPERSGPARPRSPSPSPPPRDACPSCLDDLEVLLEGRKPAELHQLAHDAGTCFVSLTPEGDRLIARQPDGRQCLVFLVDKSGAPFVISRIAYFEVVLRDVPLPASVTGGPPGTRYMGAAVRVVTASGPELLYIFTDCDILSPEICGGGCTPIVRPPQCLSRVLAEVLRSQSKTKGKHKPGREPTACFERLKVGGKEASFEMSGRRCRLVFFDAQGRASPISGLSRGHVRWAGLVPARPPIGGMRFTGYVVVDEKGSESGVYSDCDMPPQDSCVTIIVDVENPIPPPVGDPVDVCVTATQEAADDRARFEVERAQGEFETLFRSVHYNRCFGSALQESFTFQARSREYHYTLRYYDQAGNLVQTVPPEGVAPATGGAPAHRLMSKFRYNSREQIVSQTTPDTGERTFFYDRANRLRFSQNAQQRADGVFAYVRHDGLGREIEAGIVRGVGEAVIRARIDELAFPSAADGTLEQVTRTIYDGSGAVPACAAIVPRNLRGRVAAVLAATSLGMSTLCYSYDTEGRTTAILRDLPGLGTKVLEYDYDPLTGRVAGVHYQRGQPDSLHQRPRFNRRNEILSLESSRDGVIWERDARYEYFAHGPLARIELGDARVQGLDYTYTIEGLPKGLNTGTLTGARDPGHDGVANAANAAVLRDVVGQTLEFFAGDYTPVGVGAGTLGAGATPHSSAVVGTTASAFALDSCVQSTVPDGCGLFEGNLARSVLGLEGLDGFARVTGFAYRYDRLYRLTASASHAGLDPLTNSWPSTSSGSLWRTSVGYDANGNIRTLGRDALASTTPSPTSAAMDRLTYRYASDTQGRLAANRLEHVIDGVGDGVFAEDLDDQGSSYTPLNAGTHNFAYDANGNLVRDRAAGITAIAWNMHNRVAEVERGAERIEFLYDGLGQRFAKVVRPSSDPVTWEIEHFVRDENGKIVATYRTPAGSTAATPALEELYLRGAEDLGVLLADRSTPANLPAGTFALIRGDKQYQLSNYLGHVLGTVSDRRRAVLNAAGAITGYEPWVLSTTDYDPFGAPSPGRFVETDPYRYGFNHYERDDELKGPGNSYYTHERLFDPRLGRWLSPDPIQLAESSPYAAFSNNPLRFGDPRGQLDWDSFKDTMENVAITARDIGRDAAYVFSGAAAVDAIEQNLVKAKTSYDKGQTSEAIAHAIGIQDAIESLAQKDLDWQEGGATVEDRVRMGVGEVSGMNNVLRAVTGETEFGEPLDTAERWQQGISGTVRVVTIAATGASIATSIVPKAPGSAMAPKPSVKTPSKPPCVSASFASGTSVWMADGLKPIESVQSGDAVFAWDPELGKEGSYLVEDLAHSQHADGVRLVLEGGDRRIDVVTTTSEHPFWKVGTGWVEAGHLQVGDELAGTSGTLRVREHMPVVGDLIAFNLSVDEASTYFVGELGAWVHNCKKIPKARKGPGTVPKAQRDPQRLFPRKTVDDKLKKLGGKCEQCRKPLKLKDAKGHHKKRHADGGRTTKRNLGVVCDPCHKKIHK